MKEITFGQYYPSNSFVHKMDARVKILLTIAFIVGIFLISSENFYLGYLLCFVFLTLTTMIAKIPFFKVLKSIKTVIFFVVFSAILQLFFNKTGQPLWENGFIYTGGIKYAVFLTFRIIFIVMWASLLTFTTSPVEISDGIEGLLYPLKWIKFPVHEFALIMSIALRFIPTLLDETERIIKAQKARGADFESGGLIKRARAIIPILIPLLISAFRRADELADAMDSRCYAGSKIRTKYKKLKIGYRDLISTIIIAGLIFALVYLNGVIVL